MNLNNYRLDFVRNSKSTIHLNIDNIHLGYLRIIHLKQIKNEFRSSIFSKVLWPWTQFYVETTYIVG